MGDRGIVKMISEGQLSLNFYTHWGASSLPTTVADGLARGVARWDDDSYLNRIIFSEMIQHEVLDETGYGISVGDLDYDAWRVVTINHEFKTVEISDMPKTWSFEDYVAAFSSANVG